MIGSETQTCLIGLVATYQLHLGTIGAHSVPDINLVK